MVSGRLGVFTRTNGGSGTKGSLSPAISAAIAYTCRRMGSM